ncbi:kelch-like protein 36 [Polyodon spathula]|uniref:kelch-like protein 36 n=1 Tax=Polyodon spathula TaxID=7913 RepID=UPI001B7E7CDC|nr:kelch-like protein 36 [Polyodon spathula]
MEGAKQTRVSRPHRISESSKVYRLAEHPGTVLQGLNEQRQKGLFCDIILLADEQRVPAHRNLLAVYSDYFNSMFTIGMREACQLEVELVGASYIGLKAVIDFLYSSELPLDGGNIDYVLETAHLLQVWQVVDFCCEYLENEVSEENYLYLQELAFIYSLDRLDSYIDSFILCNFGTLSFTPDFLQNLRMQKLCYYLASNHVQHDCEHNLLQAALQWLTQNPERESDARLVLANIHFPLIPMSDLQHRVKPTVCALLPKEANCEALIEEALGYHSQLMVQPVLQNKRSTLRADADQLLFVGGEVSERGEELSDDVCFLDPAEGRWVSETEIPARRSHHCVTVMGGFIFVAGGSSSRDNGGDAASNVLYRYDPRCNEWIKGTPMKQRRVDFYLGTIADRLIAVGGRNDNGALSSVEVYSPQTDTWSYVAGLPRFTYGHAGSSSKEFIYISGGHDYQIGPYRRNMLCYNYRTDVWEEKHPMIKGRGWHSMCTLQEHIYAIGGSDDHVETMERFDILSVERFSPQCNQWTRVAPLFQATSESGVAVLGSKIYILGGYSWENTVFSKIVQVYDLETNKWTRGVDLPKCIAGVSACICKVKPRSLEKKLKMKGHQLNGRGSIQLAKERRL